MSAIGLFLLGAALFLVWCGIKGEDPRDVLKRTVSNK